MDDDQARELEALEGILSNPRAEPMKLSYGLLKSVTENFSNEIGHGAFGVVYMGVLQNGDVAVKKLSNLHELSDKQFLDEIMCLKRAKHKNIVRFLGYCSETQEELLEFNGANVMAEVKEKLLCFEYVPGGNIRHYLEEKPHEDDWPVRYQMIRGICQGLSSLHDKNINHLDLKPENVMLDAHMEAKITDFGLSRFLDQGKSMVTQPRLLGTPRYIAPEIIKNGDISFKSDIYALGIVIIELLTVISRVDIDNWDESLDMDRPRMQRCTEIARNCMDPDRHSRLTIQEVLSELDELESMVPWSSINQLPVTPTAFPGNEMIDVYPLELKFPFVPNQEMRCHLTLTNKTDGVVMVNIPGRYRVVKFDGFLQPMCTAVITLTREPEEELPKDTESVLEIQMLTTGCHDALVKQQIRMLCLDINAPFEHVFNRAYDEMVWAELHQAMLTAVVVASEDRDDVYQFEAMHTVSKEEAKEEDRGTEIFSMDVHPTEPWVLIEGFTKIYIWNWLTKERIGVHDKKEMKQAYEGQLEKPWYESYVAKFIAREQWVVLGTRDGSICVLTCPTMKNKVKEFKAHRDGKVTALAVHPARPFLLSCGDSDYDSSLKLWDWNNDWSCTGIFDNMYSPKQVMFDPKHATTFATLNRDAVVMMWRIGQRNPIAAMKLLGEHYCRADDFTYIGHRHHIAVTDDTNRQHVRMYDLQKKKHVHTFYYDVEKICAVVCHPTRPVLVAAVNDGSIHVWDSTTYRLKKIYENFRGNPTHIGFTGSKRCRLVIGYRSEGILVLDAPPRQQDDRVMSPTRAAMPEPVQFPLPGSGTAMPALGMPRADAPSAREKEDVTQQDTEMPDVGAGQPAPEKEDEGASCIGAETETPRPAEQHIAQPGEEKNQQTPPPEPTQQALRTPQKLASPSPATATPRSSPRLPSSPAGTPQPAGRSPQPAPPQQKRAPSLADLQRSANKSKASASGALVAKTLNVQAPASSSSTALAVYESSAATAPPAPALHMSAAAGTITTTAATRHGQISTRTDSGGSLGVLVDEYINPWNAADEGEVSSANPHPLGGHHLGQQSADFHRNLVALAKQWSNMQTTMKKSVDVRAALHRKLILEHNRVSELLSQAQEQLHEAQASAQSQAQINALTAQVIEIQAEKDSMAKALQDVKLDDEKHLAELQHEKDAVNRLKAEMEKMKKEHASKIEKVTSSCTTVIIEAQKKFEEKAKEAAVAAEKELKAEIERLKEENRLQKEEADKVAKKMLEWTALAFDLNHKMEVACLPTKDLSALSDIAPETQEAACDAILKAREEGLIPDIAFWSMEDHLVAMSDRVDHMAILGKELPLAAIAAFKALWPEKPVPKKVKELCDWVGAALPRLYEWRESAGRQGLDTALRFIMSWYEKIDLKALKAIRSRSKYIVDEACIKERQEAACAMLKWARVHTFFKDISAPESDEEDVEDDLEGSDGSDADDADEAELLITR